MHAADSDRTVRGNASPGVSAPPCPFEEFVGGRFGIFMISGGEPKDPNPKQDRANAVVTTDHGAQLARPAKRLDYSGRGVASGCHVRLAEQPLDRQLLLRPVRRLGKLM